MMKTAMILSLLLLGVSAPVLSSSSFAQDSGEGTESRALRPSELSVGHYRPQWTDVAALKQFMDEVHTRHVFIEMESAPGSKQIQGVTPFVRMGESILVRGSQEQVQGFLADLRRFDEAIGSHQHQPAPEPELVQAEYEPRFMDVAELERALERYKRFVQVGTGKDAEHFPNLTFLYTRGMILLHETPERAAEIQVFLLRLDRPAQAVTISYQVLESDPRDGEPTPLPAELGDNLRRLVPFEHFRVELSGLVRGSTRGDMSVREHSRELDARLSLEIEPAGFDAETGSLTLQRLWFEHTHADGQRSFETSATLRAGEYTVLGAGGPRPVFLVLRLNLD